MRLSIFGTIAALASIAAADFFISNTSVCMAAFPLSQCYHGVAVLSGVVNNTDYNCNKLLDAEDNNYMRNGTVGPYGSPHMYVPEGICNSGQINFEKLGDDGFDYTVTDKDGKNIGHCEHEKNVTATANSRNCNQWVGMVYFQTAYRCTSSVCG